MGAALDGRRGRRSALQQAQVCKLLQSLGQVRSAEIFGQRVHVWRLALRPTNLQGAASDGLQDALQDAFMIARPVEKGQDDLLEGIEANGIEPGAGYSAQALRLKLRQAAGSRVRADVALDGDLFLSQHADARAMAIDGKLQHGLRRQGLAK